MVEAALALLRVHSVYDTSLVCWIGRYGNLSKAPYGDHGSAGEECAVGLDSRNGAEVGGSTARRQPVLCWDEERAVSEGP